MDPRQETLSFHRSRLMEGRAEQLSKALWPMEVRPAGRMTRAREEQRAKALPPMVVRVAGKVTRAREEQR